MWRVSIALFVLTASWQCLAVTMEADKETPPVNTSTGISETTSSDKSSDEKVAMKINPEQQDSAASEEETDSDAAKIMEISNECNDTFRIQNGYFEELLFNGSFPDETDRTPKCFVRCMLEKLGVVSDEGVFDVAQVLPLFGQTNPGEQNLMMMCAADRKETCKCEKSYQFCKCIIRIKMASEKDRMQ